MLDTIQELELWRGKAGSFLEYVDDLRINRSGDHLQGVVRLILENRLMTVEHKWRLSAGEGLDGFRHALDQAIDACVP